MRKTVKISLKANNMQGTGKIEDSCICKDWHQGVAGVLSTLESIKIYYSHWIIVYRTIGPKV